MPRYLAVDADARGLFIAVGTVARGAFKLDQTLGWVEDGPPLGPATAKALGTKLKDLLKQAKVAPAPVLICVGRDRVILKDVKYPKTPPADEPAVVRFQATKDLTESPDEVAVDYLPLPPADPESPERHATVVFLRREILASARVFCEAAGLKLAGVTPRPFAAAAAAARAAATGAVPAPEPADAPVAVVTLTDSGGEFTVTRAGWVKYSRAISSQAVSSEAALVAELRRNLAVYSGQRGGAQIEAVFLAEADTGTEGWSGRLQAALPVPVYPFDPLSNTVAGEMVPGKLRGRFAGPVGLLALKAAGDLPVNFHTPRQPRNEGGGANRKLVLAACLGLLVLGTLAVGGYVLRDKEEGQVAELKEQLEAAKKLIDGMEADQKRLAAADEFARREVVWVDEMYDLSQKFPDVGKMKVVAFTGKSLPAPTEKERQKEAAALKDNPAAAKNAPPKPVATLHLKVVADNDAQPSALVQALKAEPKYYLSARQLGGALAGAAGGAARSVYDYTIDVNLAHRPPGDYRTRLVPAPRAAPTAAPPRENPDEADGGSTNE